MVGFFARFLEISQAKMHEPKAFGLFHLTFFALSVILGIWLFKLCPKPNEKFVRKLLIVTSVAVIILEIYKQVILSFTYFRGQVAFCYNWQFFPFQFCSTPMYVGILAGFAKNKRLHKTCCSFLATFCLTAGLLVMLCPINVFTTSVVINVQTMICHGSMLTVGIFLIFTGYVPISKKSIKSAIFLFLCFVTMAIILNEIAFRFGISNFNMFFISPYVKSQIPVLLSAQGKFPFGLILLIYIVGFTILTHLVSLILTEIKNLSKK